MSLERKVRAYIAAVEGGAVGDDLAAFYHPDAIQHEFPNRLVPHGAARDLDAILQGAERGSKLMERQIYDIHTVTELGDNGLIEVVRVISARRASAKERRQYETENG